jgi:hypothetical protein
VVSTFTIYDPEHWRSRAEEMRRLAEDIRDPIVRANMLEIARQYDQLAHRVEEPSAAKHFPCQQTAGS